MKIEWIKMDGMMVAIDKATGEILNESLVTIPADIDISETVMGVLDDMFGNSFNTTSQIKTETRGRKAKGVSNPYASFFSSVQYNEDTDSNNMVDALDDLVYSASTASSGNTRIPVKQLVHVMRNEDLSSKAIQNTLGKRRIIKGGEAPGIRYCQELLKSAESLIKRIEMHQERGTINLSDSSAFQFEQDSMDYERSVCLSKAVLCPVEFTEGDRRIIRALAKVGEVEAINDYLLRITEHSGRMMGRITSHLYPSSLDSKTAFGDLNAEFPYEPYEEDEPAPHQYRVKPIIRFQGEKESCKKWMHQIEKYVE